VPSRVRVPSFWLKTGEVDRSLMVPATLESLSVISVALRPKTPWIHYSASTDR
jgi:hypothetical protein